MVKIRRNAAQCLQCNDVIESTDSNQTVECSCGAIKITGGTKMVRHLKGGKNLRQLVEYEPIVVQQPDEQPAYEPMADE